MKPLSALVGMVTGAMVTTFGLGNAASAADFSFRGTFAQDDDVQLFDFSVLTPSAVTFRTYSYAGGTQADGTIIAGGGFDPVLTLFDGNGKFVAANDDDDSGTVAQDPKTGQGYDSLLNLVLAAGNYTVALTQFGNFTNSANLADGFRQAGNGNYTSGFSRCTTDSPFCDFTGTLRTNQWAFDAQGVLPLLEADEDIPDKPDKPVTPVTPVTPVIPIPNEPGDETTQVPEPTATVAIALAGMLAMAKRRRNR